jgi:FkbM family methyltransferase
MLFNLSNLIKTYNLNIKGAIQAGAHYGSVIEEIHNNNISNILCFEPVPSSFKILNEKFQNKVKIYNLALGNENKKILMNVETANKGMSSSILEPKLHLIQYPHIKFDSKIEVEMVRLDDFIEKEKQINKTDYNFICLDVQGYELEVLKGARKILNYIDYILCEVNRDQVYDQCPHVNEVDQFLSEYNFDRILTNWDGNTWGDALYIKQYE